MGSTVDKRRWAPLWLMAAGLVLVLAGHHAPQVLAAESDRPASQTCPPRNCWHDITNLPDCETGYVAWYYRSEVTLDDGGRVGAGNCGGAPCQNSITLDAPSFPYQNAHVTGVWWRMHDHEEDVAYDIYSDGASGKVWEKSDGVHTSGESCKEPCSMNTARYHPPGDQGCEPSFLPVPAPADTWFRAPSEWRDASDCALSFDEHNDDDFKQDQVTSVELSFRGEGGETINSHIHIHDVVWVLCVPPSLDVYTVDGDDNPVNTERLVVAKRDGGRWIDTDSECSNCSHHRETTTGLLPGDSDGIGAYADPYDGQVIMDIRAEPYGKSGNEEGNGYWWPEIAYEYEVVVELATKTPTPTPTDTPTPTPTPYLEMSAVDSGGDPVEVASLISGARDGSFLYPVDYPAAVSELSSGFGGWAGYDAWGGVVSLYGDQVLMDVNHSSGGRPYAFSGLEGYEWTPWSTGRKEIEFVVATATPRLGQIYAHAFRDDDGDGDADAGEPGLPSIRVDVSSGAHGVTDSAGDLVFTEPPGSYDVTVDDDDTDVPTDARLTTARTQTVDLEAAGEEYVYFGFQQPGTVQAHVFRDDDGDGTQDSGEPGLPNIRVDVSSGSHGNTNSSGLVGFSEYPGSYTVDVDESDTDVPAGARLTTPGSQSVDVVTRQTTHVYFGFQQQGTIEGLVYLDENRNGSYNGVPPDGFLPDVSVDINCQYGQGAQVETDGNGQYSLSGMPAGTCNIGVDESDTDIPEGSVLIEGDNPASVTLSGGGTAGERYGFAPPETWAGGTPSGEVFVHTYVPGLPTDQADYLADEVIHLDIQRWSGLAPVFKPDDLPELCLTGTSTCTTGDVRTLRFVVEDIDGDGEAIENLTGQQPAFEYPDSHEVVYNRDHVWGDTNYDDEEYLWVIMLSKGGLTPDDGLASPVAPVRAVAETGYPGTYQVEGTLYLRAEWAGIFTYEHDWDIPIEFYITQRAPYPQDPQ